MALQETKTLSFLPTNTQAALGWGSNKSKPKAHWHRPRARPRLLHRKSPTAAQVAFSVLHTLLDSELDKSQSVQNGDHTTRSGIVGSSSIPMAQKHLVELWRGQAGAGGFYHQLHFRFPKGRPCSHPDRAQLTPHSLGQRGHVSHLSGKDRLARASSGWG